MKLYEVTRGVINVKSVLRETKSGWREHNNGFINRSVMKNFFRIEGRYYTTDLQEAEKWQNEMVNYMHYLIQVSSASRSDIESWVSNGMDEKSLPDSRVVVSNSMF